MYSVDTNTLSKIDRLFNSSSKMFLSRDHRGRHLVKIKHGMMRLRTTELVTNSATFEEIKKRYGLVRNTRSAD